MFRFVCCCFQKISSQVTTDYTQYNKLRNGEATPDVAEVKAIDHQNTTYCKQGIYSLPPSQKYKRKSIPRFHDTRKVRTIYIMFSEKSSFRFYLKVSFQIASIKSRGAKKCFLPTIISIMLESAPSGAANICIIHNI